MEERATRGPGGMLALWVFYAYCGYFIWAMLRYVWVVIQFDPIPGTTLDGAMGSTFGKLIGALLGFLVLGIVGSILGGIAWYTRPRGSSYSES
ncbi:MULTISPECIES: cell division protein DrpB [Enterobacterales]|uniref:cell division protein DrpB n=1 Tax=Enterobacterales TaxID=91347 RepID=UPI002EDAEB4A